MIDCKTQLEGGFILRHERGAIRIFRHTFYCGCIRLIDGDPAVDVLVPVHAQIVQEAIRQFMLDEIAKLKELTSE